jgi:hypothetical protein
LSSSEGEKVKAPKHSRIADAKKGVVYTDCAECDRGGNGTDKDKCSCGWRVKVGGRYGCYLGKLLPGLAFEEKKP